MLQNISPIMVDLLLKKEIPPEQLGMNFQDVNRLQEEVSIRDENLLYSKNLPLVVNADPQKLVTNAWLSNDEELENSLLRYIRMSMMIVVALYLLLRGHFLRSFDTQNERYTIRVNTFRRNDLLKQFLDHYTTCPDVKEIQVVWSDQKIAPPFSWLELYEKDNKDKVHISFIFLCILSPYDAVC